MGGMSGLGASLLGFASSGAMILFGVTLVAVGLGTVRRTNGPAGMCLAGAGALAAFAALVRLILSFALSFMGFGTLYTLTSVLTTGMNLIAAVLVPVSIFLLANAIKQGAGQTQGPRIHY
jgi:hypothetical protein